VQPQELDETGADLCPTCWFDGSHERSSSLPSCLQNQGCPTHPAHPPYQPKLGYLIPWIHPPFSPQPTCICSPSLLCCPHSSGLLHTQVSDCRALAPAHSVLSPRWQTSSLGLRHCSRSWSCNPETASWRIPHPPAAIIRLAARPDSSGYCSLATITSSLDTCDTLSSPRTTQRTLSPRHIKRTISLFVLRHHKNTGGH